MQFLNQIPADSFEDKVFGCIIGAFIGDSCGSYLEFITNTVDEDQMDECMMMLGGGIAFGKIGSGQVTDDSELAMCLLQGIVEGNEERDMD